MKLYIAGPITGVPDYEERFRKAEEDLKAMGHTVINPVKDKGFTYKQYIDMGLCQLMQCDAIYMLKGYEKSKGARLELAYAATVGMDAYGEEIEKCK